MRRLSIRSLVILLLICLVMPVQLPVLSSSPPPNLNGLDSFVEQVMKDWYVPGLAVAIVKDGHVVYAKGFGSRDLNKGLKVTTDTLFAIGSCSKAFTATAMGILVDEGKLDWDKPLRDYLPDFKLSDSYATDRIRPRDLVTHQSGLPRHDMMWYGSQLSRRELYERLQYLEPSKPIHSKFQYNNLMFMAAGVLVERISGSTWEEFVRRKILDPLAMKTSNFSVNDSQKMPDFSLPYSGENGVIKGIPFRNIDAVGPAGSINSSVNEMSRWLLLQMNKGKVDSTQIISEKNLGEIHTPQIVAGGDLKYDESFYTNYAMGWVVTSYRGHPALAHGGGIDGFTSQVRFLPKDQLGVVVLTNSGSPASGLIVNNAIDRMLGLPEAPWAQRAKEDLAKSRAAQLKAKVEDEAKRKKDAQPTHTLVYYTGQYEHPAYQTLTITQEGGQLKADLHNLKGNLKHYHYDIFQGVEGVAGLGGTKLTFLMNRAGEIDRVSIPLESSVKEIVFTRKPKPEEKTSASTNRTSQ
ncbi:MAG: serine hydrolase [Acidobacteria bacterium]|nr:serine hydrolase [Acidobacteriota bacterium]